MKKINILLTFLFVVTALPFVLTARSINANILPVDSTAFYADSTDVAAADTLSVVADSAMSVVDSLSTAVDSAVVAVNDSVSAAVGSIAATAADSISSVVDSIAMATVDSIAAVVDSAAVVSADSISAVVDSVAIVAADSISSAVDSVMPVLSDSTSLVDSAAVAVADTLSALVDSVSVAAVDSIPVAATDSLSKAAVDSVAVVDSDTICIPRTVAASEVRYFKHRPMSQDDKQMLTTYYKEILSVGNQGELYLKAYEPWREVFVADTNRSLDLYIDGVGIITSCIANDTAQHRYDRLSQFKWKLMELYDMAVADIENLNSQLDKARSKDTLSVAKFRGQQIAYYRRLTQYDSIFNSTHHNVLNSENEQYWEDVIFKDSTHMLYLYPRYRELLQSDDNNLNMAHIAHFAKMVYFKIIIDNRNLGSSRAKEYYTSDKDLINTRVPGILSSASTVEKLSNGLTVAEYYAGLADGASGTLLQGESAFISSDDYGRLEEYYVQRLEKDGNKVWQEILSSALSRSTTSELYYQALVHKYIGDQAEFIEESGPTFDLALKIARYAQGMSKYGDAIKYYDLAFLEMEFYELTAFEQAQWYLRMVQVMQDAKQSGQRCYAYVKKAMDACPEYPEPYYVEASLFSKAVAKATGFNKEFSYVILYNLYAKVKSVIEALGNISDTNVVTRLDIKDIENSMRMYKGHFPSSEEVFMRGLQGKEHSLKALGKTYKAKVLTRD